MTAVPHELPTVTPTANLAPVTFLALDLTGRCQLTCTHCYAESGPTGSHGTMTAKDWCAVIEEAAGMGVSEIQFIGGEPTLHPAFEEILQYAIVSGVPVEIFSNLYRVSDAMWELFARPGIILATSYYSDDPEEHAAITGRPDSYGRTRANIVKAVGLGIPIRASIVKVLDEQRTEQAHAELAALGVKRIRPGVVQQLGRAAGTGFGRNPDQLCGRCGHRRLAISSTGNVTPCVMSGWMVTGNVHRQSLAEILAGQAWHNALTQIPAQAKVCAPECNPASDGDDCPPAQQIDGE